MAIYDIHTPGLAEAVAVWRAQFLTADDDPPAELEPVDWIHAVMLDALTVRPDGSIGTGGSGSWRDRQGYR